MVPTAKVVEAVGQVRPQLIPVGLEMTVPLPAPDLLTVRRFLVEAVRLNVAVTGLSVLTIVEQVEEFPEQAPPQPANLDPWAAVAVRVTGVH